MPANTLDPLFGIHAEALRLERTRLELIAGNLANADTPNYKAKDLDFRKALAQAAGVEQGLVTTDSAHIALAAPVTPSTPDGVTLRAAKQNSLDGNTVDGQREQAAFAEAAVHYQASLMFAENRIKTLLTAISGE